MSRVVKYTSVERLEAVAIKALMGGYGRLLYAADLTGAPIRRKVAMNIAMDCDNPYIFELHARWSTNPRRRVKPLWLEGQARCRKCAPCKARRAMYWRGRAFDEYMSSKRTIFGTLTTSPEFDAMLDARITIALAKRGVDFARLPDIEQFRERVKFGGDEIAKYLKRLRGAARSARRVEFRYLLIAEAHNSAKTAGAKRNRPHWHVLFHEIDECRPLVLPSEFAIGNSGNVRTDRYGNPYLSDEAFLKSQWTAGYSTFLVAGTPQAATYVCKYLTKDANHRIRCSFRYGKTQRALTADRETSSASGPQARSGEEKIGPTSKECQS